jgi:RND family efflux transporter MFP subunit
MSTNSPETHSGAPFFLDSVLTNRRKSAFGLLVLTLVTGLALAGRWQFKALAESRQPTDVVSPPALVEVLRFEPEVVVSGLRYSAVVKEFRKSVLSFRVGGTLENLLQSPGPDGRPRSVQDGDQVARGAILARLDTADYRRDQSTAAERQAGAEARLEQARSDSAHARLEFDRYEKLVGKGAAARSEFDLAQATLRKAAASETAAERDLEASRIALQQAEANLSYCTLAAPFDATVASVYVDNFERVAANQRAFLLLDLSSVLISFAVPDTLVGKLAVGQPVDVRADSLPSERFDGVISLIGATADAQTRTYPIEVQIRNHGALRPGMIATVNFRSDRTACLLPLTAMLRDSLSKQHEVFRVVEEQGETVVRKARVEFDDIVDNRVVVRAEPGALAVGDRVVATGVHRLFDGQRVQIAH